MDNSLFLNDYKKLFFMISKKYFSHNVYIFLKIYALKWIIA